jgi:putative MATE family efflux protein
VDLFGGDIAVSDYAATYLRWALLGVTPALVMLAATGVLRGLLDTRTPLVVAVAGNLLNVGLNLLLVYGLDLGIAGSAIGTDLAQLASAVALVACVVRIARREGAPLSPVLDGMRRAGAAGVPLLVRTVAQRTSLLGMTYAAAQLDSTAVATQQLALTIWLFLSFVLDAIAIAAQALTGRFLGAGDVERTRSATALMIRWGLLIGGVTGLGLAAVSPWVGWLFTADEAVIDLLVPTLLVAALFQPVAGVAFVLDGVLIGAGDGRYLARAAVIVLVIFAPLATLAIAFPPPGVAPLAWLWVSFGVGFIGGRAAILLRRAHGTAWMVTGAQ